MAIWITWREERVAEIIFGGDNSPKSDGGVVWQKVPDNWGGTVGDKREWFDEDTIRTPDHELVNMGIRRDNRGCVYSTEKAGETRIIHNLDEDIPEGFTKEPPLENEHYQKWDSDQEIWVVETEKKAIAEKESELATVQAKIEEAERRTIRHLRSIRQGRDDDDTKFNEYDSLIENELRPEYKRIELEIKQLKQLLSA
jgi:hypothetical protein